MSNFKIKIPKPKKRIPLASIHSKSGAHVDKKKDLEKKACRKNVKLGE